ncbi:MAG: hypothetical protein WBA13_09780 [Microcoleaceae cyanobacterium]
MNNCSKCLNYSWTHYLVCAVHPTGPEHESCDDFDPDPETEAILYKDFLGIGEAEIDDMINNPWHRDPEKNWSPPGTKYVDGELVFIED